MERRRRLVEEGIGGREGREGREEDIVEGLGVRCRGLSLEDDIKQELSIQVLSCLHQDFTSHPHVNINLLSLHTSLPAG